MDTEKELMKQNQELQEKNKEMKELLQEFKQNYIEIGESLIQSGESEKENLVENVKGFINLIKGIIHTTETSKKYIVYTDDEKHREELWELFEGGMKRFCKEFTKVGQLKVSEGTKELNKQIKEIKESMESIK